MKLILDAGVPRTIPHVYTSIIDKATGCTKIDEVKNLLAIVKELA